VIAVLEKARVPVALIGGLALAPYGVVRATQDVDLLTDSNSADALDRELSELGYRCVHRSADAANYLRGDERLDLLYASRPVARQLLAAAQPRAAPRIWRIYARCCVQTKRRSTAARCGNTSACSNGRPCSMNSSPKSIDSRGPAPRRSLLVASGGIRVPVQTMRDPFEALDDLMVVVEALCPTWPHRESFGTMPDLRL
jgi:hypothetical protein